MQDLIEAYLSVYDDINEVKGFRAVMNRPNMEESYMEIDERRLFPGAPDYSDKFPLTYKEKKLVASIGRAARDMAKQQSELSTTKSGRSIPVSTPTNTSVSSRPKKSRGTTSKSGDTWTADQHENFYDIVLDHLLDEGYCDSEENAISMMAAMSEDWIDSITEKFSMAKDTSMPQSPKPTKLPISREENIGKHDDWKDTPSTKWGDRPPAGNKLRSRATTVVGTQQRQDTETGIR